MQGIPLTSGARGTMPTQEMLAKMLACSRESVNKELQRLCAKKIIKKSRRAIWIVNVKKLQELADFGNGIEHSLWRVNQTAS